MVSFQAQNLQMPDETQKRLILRAISTKKQEFFNLHGFEVGLLERWFNGCWFDVGSSRLIVTNLDDRNGQQEGSHQKLVTDLIKFENKVAFTFRIRVDRYPSEHACKVYFRVSKVISYRNSSFTFYRLRFTAFPPASLTHAVT